MAVTTSELITNQYHIKSLLQRVYASHAIVSLRRPHDDFVYNSAILDVDSDANRFTIDAPADAQLPLQVLPGDWLKFRIKLQGLLLSFDALIEDIVEDATAFRSYQLQFPAQVNYQQRRGTFRANIGYQFNVTLTAQLAEGATLRGRLTDLSLGGASLETDMVVNTSLQQAIPLHNCRLQHGPETITIEHAKVCTTHSPEANSNQYRLGIEFVDIDANERRSLQRWVMKFDRENRKSALAE